MTPTAALISYVAGIIAPAIVFGLYTAGIWKFNSATAETLYGAMISFGTVLVLGLVISLFTKPKPEKELTGLVYGLGKIDMQQDAVVGDTAWYRSPALLGTIALALCVALYIPFL